MEDVLFSFVRLGLDQIGRAYHVGIENIPKYNPDIENADFIYSQLCQEKIIAGFETVMPFSITQQHIDVAEAVRKNFYTFLASVGWVEARNPSQSIVYALPVG